MIRKGKASKPTQFGKLAAGRENQIIAHFEVSPEHPNDSNLLVLAVQEDQHRLGCTRRLSADDAGFYSQENKKSGPRDGSGLGFDPA